MSDKCPIPEEFAEWIDRSLEGTITPEQWARLDSEIATNETACDFYVRYLAIYMGLFYEEGVQSELLDLYLEPTPGPGKALDASGQKIKERVDHATPEHTMQETPWKLNAQKDAIKQFAEESLKKNKREQERVLAELQYKAYRARRRQLIVGISSLAALVAIALFVWLAPRPISESPEWANQPTLIEQPLVAEIVTSSEAIWDQNDLSTDTGTRLRAVPLFLKQGLVLIAFDKGAEVLLQAPCNIILENPEQMYLEGGSVAVTASEGYGGFIVRTLTGVVVDIGTEFGVIVRQNHTLETQVYKGAVDLRSGSDPARFATSMHLVKGQAGTVNQAGKVVLAVYRAHQIMREMPEKPGFAIAGKRLSLADVVGGGNGFGTGINDRGIDTTTGVIIDVKTISLDYKPDIIGYVAVPELPMIDGVFVPDGRAGPIQISSSSLKYAGCPKTSGAILTGLRIFNGGWHAYTENGVLNVRHELTLNGQAYGPQRCIAMRANQGITFDLDEIRATISGLKLDMFTTLYGVSETAWEKSGKKSRADFWILVDGVVHVTKTMASSQGSAFASVALTDQDRFLTLMTTEGDDGMGTDWTMFAEPALKLLPIKQESKQQEKL